MSGTKLVLLGTGTPIMEANRYQSALAVVVDETPYIVDCGSDILERLAHARTMGVTGLENKDLKRLFLTHYHPDHSVWLPGFMICPWNMGRKEALEIYAAEGIQAKVEALLAAYRDGIEEHLYHGPKSLDPIQVKPVQISAGTCYEDALVSVEAVPVIHGSFDAFGFKFVAQDKTIMVSGDTRPSDLLCEKAHGCDILVHEVYCKAAAQSRPAQSQHYFRDVHTSAVELGVVAAKVQPGLLVLTHQIAYGMPQEDAKNQIIREIRQNYSGEVAYGNDLDVFA